MYRAAGSIPVAPSGPRHWIADSIRGSARSSADPLGRWAEPGVASHFKQSDQNPYRQIQCHLLTHGNVAPMDSEGNICIRKCGLCRRDLRMAGSTAISSLVLRETSAVAAERRGQRLRVAHEVLGTAWRTAVTFPTESGLTGRFHEQQWRRGTRSHLGVPAI